MIQTQAASTVIVARDGAHGIEVYLVRRSSASAFMPDVFVFPGGRVDPQDRSATATAHMYGTDKQLEPAFFAAAIRETFEEAGILFATTPLDAATLAQARASLLRGNGTFAQMLTGLEATLDASALHYFSRWITPPGKARRFDTCFFVARMPAGQVAQADAIETHDGQWVTPVDALGRSAAGELALMFPTRKHLERIDAFSDVAKLLDYTRGKSIVPVMPGAIGGSQFELPTELEGRW